MRVLLATTSLPSGGPVTFLFSDPEKVFSSQLTAAEVTE